MRDIRDALDLSSTSIAAYWIKAAEDFGYLMRPPVLQTRSLVITDAGHEAIAGMDIHAHVAIGE